MMNYLLLDDTHIQMEFGILGDVTSFHKLPTGELFSVNLGGKNMVVTHIGELVPAYTQTPRRKNKPSVEFHPDGMIKAVYLEEQTEVETPIGTLPAEYVMFYPTGELHRVFISDGQISGFWTQEEESEYQIPLTFDFEFSQFTAKLNGICFYKNGDIRSITLYPGESAVVNTPAGEIVTEIGFSLYESGALKSIEPKEAVLIKTPIGLFAAHDPSAIGINADSNSICFDESGRLTSFKTVQHKILIQTDAGKFEILMPEMKAHPLYDDTQIRSAIKISFDFEQDTVEIDNGEIHVYSMEKDHFTIKEIPDDMPGCSPIDCATCSLCNQ
ncbi:MAG: hypothetical protein ACK5ML_09315 [Lachnospiraceae bacterium]